MNPREADLPRWLRPTLRKQRQSGDRAILSGDRAILSGDRPSARFDSPPPPGVERRTIAYRLVRVSDEPEDLRSTEVARLDRGDEVEIIGEHEGFLRVRTPSGVEGWVSRIVIVG